MEKKRLFKSTGGICLIVLFIMFSLSPNVLAKQKTIRIGFLAGLTGFASNSERVHLQGAELCRDWVNEQGGITIKGEPYLIELVSEDHKCTADGAVSGANKLVYDKKVKYIAGTVMPFTVAAVTTVTEPARVIRSLLYNCATPQEFSKNTPYTFLSQNSTVGSIISGLQFLKQKYPKTKKIKALIPDDGAIPHLKPHVEKWANIYGMELIETIGWALDTVDFTPIAIKAAKGNPDAVCMVNGWPAMIGGVLKSLRENGYTNPVMGLHNAQATDVLKVAGEAASDKYYIHGFDLNDPELPKMVRMLHKKGLEKYGHDRVTFLAEGFDAVWVLVQAIEYTQSLDPDDIRVSWPKMQSIETATGSGYIGGEKTYGLKHAIVGPRSINGLEDGKVKRFGWIKGINVP